MALDDAAASPTGLPFDPRTRLRLANLTLWHKSLLFGLVYLACAQAGNYLSPRTVTAVSFWLPAGLSVAVLLLNPTRNWPGLLLAIPPANFVFDYFHGTPPGLILFFTLANLTQTFLGAWMVRRWVAERPSLASLKEFFGLMGLSAGLSTIPAALIAVSALRWYHRTQLPFGQGCFVWWGSNVMAIVVVAPFLLTWFANTRDSRDVFYLRDRRVEACLFGAALCLGLGYGLGWQNGIFSQYRSLIVPLLLWAGLRFGRRGATITTLFLSIVLSFFTTQLSTGLTPIQLSAGQYLFFMQILLAMSVLIALIPAIVLHERDRSLINLRDSEERFRQLTQAAFEGICLSENGRIIDANEQILKIFGYERHELIGRDVMDLITPEYRPAVAEAIRRHQEPPYEQVLQRKDGTRFHAEVRAKVVFIGNRIIRMAALRDVTDRKRVEAGREQAETRERQARLNYTLQLIAYQEAERTRIAAELHDGLGQNLLLIKNRAQFALLGQPPAGEPREHLEAIGDLATQAIAEARQISYDLHPYQLDHLGLTHAIEAMIDHARESSGITFQHKLDNVDRVFSKELALSLYRIIQESLHNILKHSGAKNARICLEHDIHEVVLQIEDDGRGYDAAARPENAPGFGLKNIAGRARLLGGRLTVESTPGQGARLVLNIPVAEN